MCIKYWFVYLSLYHIGPLCSHGFHTVIYIHLALHLGLVQEVIHRDEGPCATNPRTEIKTEGLFMLTFLLKDCLIYGKYGFIEHVVLQKGLHRWSNWFNTVEIGSTMWIIQWKTNFLQRTSKSYILPSCWYISSIQYICCSFAWAMVRRTRKLYAGLQPIPWL